MNYSVGPRKTGYLEHFEKNNDNTAEIAIRGKNRLNITHKCKVEISISKNGMIGLAKELIRETFEANPLTPIHFYPARPNHGIVQTVGILLVPNSAEPIMDFWEVGQLNNYKISRTFIANPQHFSYTISEKPEELEDFEKANDNICQFKVFDENSNDISSLCCYIELGLSKNAMLGLGTELIRLANNFEEGKEVHIIPASKEKGAQQAMGIFLTPDSCELVIKCEHFEPIEKILEEYGKKSK
jgi:hypothetical protein